MNLLVLYANFSDDMIDENYGVAVQFDEDEEEVCHSVFSLTY